MQNKGILQINSVTRKISKRQAEFNRLTQRIEGLNELLMRLKEGYDVLRLRVINEVYPLQKRMVANRIAIVKKIDQIYNSDIFKSSDRKKLDHLLSGLCRELILREGLTELIPLFNKYSKVDLEEVLQSSSAGKNYTTAENPAREPQQSKVQQDEWEDGYYSYKEYPQGQKSKKKLEKEAKRHQHEKKLTRSVRSVYLDLVKTFHPDTEPDEMERDRKTDIMHRITQAYRDNDLVWLLNLQMEYNHIDQAHSDRLADEQLLYYNKVLKQQLEDLELKRKDLFNDLAQLADFSSGKPDSLDKVLFQFNMELKNLKVAARNMRNEVALWGDPHAVRAFLKTYRFDN